MNPEVNLMQDERQSGDACVGLSIPREEIEAVVRTLTMIKTPDVIPSKLLNRTGEEITPRSQDKRIYVRQIIRDMANHHAATIKSCHS